MAQVGSADSAQRLKKRTKAGVLVSSITYADLEACFGMPTEKACIQLGVGLTILKRLCRKFGIARWPYRTLLKAGKVQRSSPTPPSSPLDTLACSTPAGSQGPGCAQASSAQQQQQQADTASESSMDGQQRQQEQLVVVARAVQLQQQAAPPPPPPTAAAAVEPARPRATLARSGSQLSMLLCAIDACEAPAPAAAPATELAPGSPTVPAQLPSFRAAAATFPATPACTTAAAAPAPAAAVAACPATSPATVFQRRPFAHGRRSAFGSLARRAPPPTAAEQALLAAQQRQLLLLSGLRRKLELQLEQQRAEMAAQQRQHAARQREQQEQLVGQALQSLLGEAAAAADPQDRLRMAEKLVAVRGVLQARLARRSSELLSLDTPGGGGTGRGARYSPYTSPHSSPRELPLVAAAAWPAGLLGVAADADEAARDADALRSARSLLAQYSL